MSEHKSGDRVQREVYVGGDMTINVGQVTDVEYAERDREDYDYGRRQYVKRSETYAKSVKVQWDSGTEETLDTWMVHAEDSEMERTYRLAVKDAQRRMNEKMSQASALLDEAVAISEETGIPLDAGISPLSQSYIPGSMTEKWPDVDRGFMNDLANAYGEYDGWQHSAVC